MLTDLQRFGRVWGCGSSFFHAYRAEEDFVLAGVEVAFAEAFDFAEGFEHEFVLDVFASAVEVVLDFLLGLEPIVVLCAEVDAEFFVLFDHVKGEVLEAKAFDELELCDLFHEFFVAMYCWYWFSKSFD